MAVHNTLTTAFQAFSIVIDIRPDKVFTKLQKQAQALQSKSRKPVIASIIKSMKEYDISPEDIANAYSSEKSRGRRKAKTSVSKPVAAKYRQPETGSTWSGRGKAPRWLTEAEAAGATRDSFLIEK